MSVQLDTVERYIDVLNILDRVENIISTNASLEEDTTNPGIVITSDNGLPVELYWSAVQGVVELNSVKKELQNFDAKYKCFKSGRGIIGASAAIAWASNVKDVLLEPLDFTYELIAYRKPHRWGSKRDLEEEVVVELDRMTRSTFNNFDYRNHHIAITPNSPCPVLFGIRGEDPEELIAGKELIRPKCESIHKWLLFKTNQGTDDHLKRTEITNIEPYTSVITSGMVISMPYTLPGGHVLFELKDLNGSIQIPNTGNHPETITCAAYEPTKEFRMIPRSFLPGDIVTIYGGVRSQPLTINIEKLRLEKLAKPTVKTKIQNPKCPSCGASMKSIGKDSGFRCKKCHTKKAETEAVFDDQVRTVQEGFYEVPVAARRHLSKPLIRFKNVSGM